MQLPRRKRPARPMRPIRRARRNKTPGAYIEVFEVHGVLPTKFLAGTDEKYPDDYGADEYERQMHVVVFEETNKDNCTGARVGKSPSGEPAGCLIITDQAPEDGFRSHHRIIV